MSFEFDTPVDTAVTVAVIILCCIGLAAYFRSLAQQAKREREEHARFIERMRLECSTILSDIAAEQAARRPITDKYKNDPWVADGQDVATSSEAVKPAELRSGNSKGHQTYPSQFSIQEGFGQRGPNK